MITRRELLVSSTSFATIGALTLAGYEIYQGNLPGRPFFQEHLGLNGEDGTVPDVEPGPVEEGTFVSQARGGAKVGWALLLPPRVPLAKLGLVVALHGYGETHETLTGSDFGLDRFLAANVAAGHAPFAIATVDGGTSYWHPHQGEDAGAMVVDELLPLVQQKGVDTSRQIGLVGWSMGGYGALHLAGVLGAHRTAAVSAVSPALWTDASDAPSHGFASKAEYEKYTVFGHQDDLATVPMRLDCGTGDPFYRAVQSYADGFPSHSRTTAHFAAGGHDPGYWRRVLPADLTFLSKALSSRRSRR